MTSYDLSSLINHEFTRYVYILEKKKSEKKEKRIFFVITYEKNKVKNHRAALRESE